MHSPSVQSLRVVPRLEGGPEEIVCALCSSLVGNVEVVYRVQDGLAMFATMEKTGGGKTEFVGLRHLAPALRECESRIEKVKGVHRLETVAAIFQDE